MHPHRSKSGLKDVKQPVMNRQTTDSNIISLSLFNRVLVKNTFISALLAAIMLWGGPVMGQMQHGLSLHGPPALPPDTPLPYAQPAAPSGGRITFGVQGTFDTVNPFVVRGISAQGISTPMGLVTQSLMLRSADEPFALYGGLARGVVLDPHDRAITFMIDPEARFSDGVPVTAKDVHFTWALLKEKGRPNYRGYYGKVLNVTLPDPMTIRFELEGDDHELPLILALMPVLPAHQTDAARFEETTLTPPIGSGPYLVSEVKAGETITFQKNPHFWGRHKAIYQGLYHPDTLRYDYYRDANALFEAFKGGLVDVRIEDNPTRWATGYDFPALREGRVIREAIPIGISKGMNAFVFNTRKAVFKDRLVREALNEMLDFDWINTKLFNTLYRRSDSFFTGSPLSSIGLAANAKELALLTPYTHRIKPAILAGDWRPATLDGSGRDRQAAQRAVALLAQAGYRLDQAVMKNAQGETIQFEILVNSRLQEKLALHYAQSLQRIGVTASVRLIDDIQYWRRLSAFDFDMIQYHYSGTPSPGNEQYHRWGSQAALRQGSLNYAGAQDPAIDAMIDALVKARNPDDYKAAAHALDRVLLSGFYVVPLFHSPDIWFARKASIGRPQTVPLFGTAPETFWVDPSARP